jgi:centrosomal protein CEP104
MISKLEVILNVL